MNVMERIGTGLLIGMFVVAAGTSFAKNDHSEAELKVLSESAAALKQSNPKLSEKLSKYAAEEEKEAKQQENENDKDVAKEEEGVKMLQEAAKALKATNPELAKGLTQYAEKEKKEIAEMKGAK
jgi:predicted Zn-dependent protease